MENFRRKYFHKKKALIFLCCALALSFIIAANIALFSYKSTITKELNKNFFKPVTVKNIFYLPPNIFILKGLEIGESKINPNKKIFSIPISIVSFSISKFFLNKKVSISSVYFIGPVVDLGDFLSFAKENFSQILEFMKGLPKQDFKLSIRKITIKSPGRDTAPFETKGYFNLKIERNKISASGSAGKGNFSLSGTLAEDQLYVKIFKLNSGNIGCQLRGRVSQSLTEFKGFIIMHSSELSDKSSPLNIFILDIDSRIKFSLPRVEIERLNFSINNNPVKLTADMLIAEPFSCNLKLISNFRNLDNKEAGGLKNISLIAQLTAKEGKTLTVNGYLNINFLEHIKESLPLEKLELNVNGLVFSLNGLSVLKINAGKINLSSKTSANSYKIDLVGLAGEIYELNKPLKLVKFSSLFYGGRLLGRGYIEMHGLTPIISATIRIKDVDANQLEGILVHFSKIYGKLSSQMFFVNYPQLIFEGSMHIKNGYLNNFEFLKWLANLFDIPSLKKIYFNAASADFIVDKKGAGLFDIDLDSKNVRIKGYFNLREDDLLSSKIFLSFRRELLQESAKFKPLLKLIDKKQALINFNFQLSGKLNGMNFRWLESDFKDDLNKAIPNFAKKGFEEKVSRAIESILEE